MVFFSNLLTYLPFINDSNRSLGTKTKNKLELTLLLKFSYLLIGKNIVEQLDKYNHFLDVNHVLLENQPALKNPTMKSIQMMIYSYFLINGVGLFRL